MNGSAPASDGTPRPRRGTLRVYLGAAPGVGKTFAMLAEGRRRAERGTDVVVGLVETHGRERTAEQIGDLEVVPRRRVAYRGTPLEEMDVDAVLERCPEVALVDEMAHTNAPGSRNEKRWQDIDELLDAGIDVVTTLNIQHLESTNDVVERITGAAQRETVPDRVVRAADQVELIDMTPEALRRRMAHGNVYAADKVDAALGNYFRAGNLTALRELALLWVADQVDVGLEEYRRRHGITEPWETRERVVVALTGAPAGEVLIRRASRLAQRAHGELLGLHVRSAEGLTGPPPGALDQHRRLLEGLGGEYHEVTGADVAVALVEFAHAENATQMVLGSSARSRWDELVRGSVINKAIRLSGPIDVHVISPSREGEGDTAADTGGRGRRRPARRSPLTARRRVIGWLVAVVGVPLLTLVFAQLRDIGGPPHRAPRLPGAGGDGGLGGRHAAGAGGGGGVVDRGQLVLHPAVPHADHRRGREPGGPGGVPRGRAGGQRVRRHGRPPHGRGGPAATRPATWPGWRRRWAATTRCPPCSPTCRRCSAWTGPPCSGRSTATGRSRPTPGCRCRPPPRPPTWWRSWRPASSSPSTGAASRPRTSWSSTPSPPSSPPCSSTGGCGSRPVTPGRWPTPTPCAAPCCRRCPTTCARRWPPSRPPRRAWSPPTSTGPRRTSPRSPAPSTSRPTASSAWSRTCST